MRQRFLKKEIEDVIWKGIVINLLSLRQTAAQGLLRNYIANYSAELLIFFMQGIIQGCRRICQISLLVELVITEEYLKMMYLIGIFISASWTQQNFARY